jgi:hypothetical protein
MVGGHRAAVVFLPMLSPTSPPLPPPEAEAKNALVATASLSITAVAFSSVDSAFSSADSASTPPRMYHTCEWAPLPHAEAAAIAQIGGRLPCLCPRATERRAPAHRGRLPACRPAAVRTELPPPSAARPRTGDACPRVVPQPCERSRCHRAPRARAPGTLARAPSRSRANGAAAPTQAGTVAPAVVAQGPRPPTPGPGVTLGSRRTEGAAGGSSRGWDARLGDPRGWKERLRRGSGAAAGCADPDPRGWKERLGDPREDGRSGEAAGCAARAAAGVRGMRARQNVRHAVLDAYTTNIISSRDVK